MVLAIQILPLLTIRHPIGSVVTAACYFCCRRAMGAFVHPAFPAPSYTFEGGERSITGHIVPREH
jgi:hypothetical protein